MAEPRSTIPACIEVPPPFVPKARYALRMLLGPLGLEPQWVPRDALDDTGLYYGDGNGRWGRGVVSLPYHRATAAFFEEGEAYHPAAVRWMRWQGERWPVLFPLETRSKPDLVASTFFWLSAWQEHTSTARDEHGRFPYEASLQNTWDLALRPAVDAYREVLAERLEAAGRPVRREKWHGHEWAFCPTHDIDYLRKWRPGIVYREVVRNFLLNAKREPFSDRLIGLLLFAQDWLGPGDPFRYAFARMQAETAARGGHATFFIKTGANDPHDVYYPPRSRYLRRRIRALQHAGFEVGLHPSYRAHDDERLLLEETRRLTDVTGEAPLSVRQHYLRYARPATLRLHERAGFCIDSTLGFAEHEGFRNATCHPFQLFDTEANRTRDVWEMPLVMMDSALFNRRGMDVIAGCDVTVAVMAVCRRFGGVCVGLWHNTLWDEGEYPGWGAHFTFALDQAREEGATVTSLKEAFSSRHHLMHG